MEFDVEALQLLPDRDEQTEMLCRGITTCDAQSSCAVSCTYTN